MVDNSLERETHIEAPLETVWKLIAEPAFWVADQELVAGKTAAPDEVLVVDNPIVGKVAVRTESVTPPTQISYRWNSAFPGQDIRPDNSTLVEFTLEAEESQTRIRVVETGFAELEGSDELRNNAVNFNTEGWAITFAALAERAAKAAE